MSTLDDPRRSAARPTDSAHRRGMGTRWVDRVDEDVTGLQVSCAMVHESELEQASSIKGIR